MQVFTVCTKRLLRRSWLALLAAVVVAALCAPAVAAVPATIAIEGALQTKGGGPVSDGSYTLTFKIYKGKTEGVASWTSTAKVTVFKGAFTYVLGSAKSLAPLLAIKTGSLWVSAQVAGDPELPRVRMHAAPFALHAARAESIDCTGCIATSAIKAGSLNLTGGTLTADKVVAKTLVGDGSAITGIKVPAGQCPKGQVVTGIDKQGKLVCGSASPLPDDGIDKVSQGLIAIVGDLYNGNVPVDINDNNPKGSESKITLKNVGKVDKLTVTVKLTITSGSSGIEKLRVCLISPGGGVPNNAGFAADYCKGKFQYLLHDKGGAGKKLINTWPSPTKEISGDINEWISKDPSGTWILQVVDTNFDTNKVIGTINTFKLSARTTGNNKVNVVKDIIVDGPATFNKNVQVNGDLNVTGTVSATAAAKLIFPAGSRPFLWGWYEDRFNTNSNYGARYDQPYQAPTSTLKQIHTYTQQIVWGDGGGNFFIQKGGINYANNVSDKTQGVLVTFIKNTTAKEISHSVCLWYSSRGSYGNHGGHALNSQSASKYSWYNGGNTRGQTCHTMSFPPNKTSVLVQKSGCYQYTTWNGTYNRNLNGYYNDTWGPAKMPKGLEWDYDVFYKWMKGEDMKLN
jgi:subtilisin-like proprotein convertase family protein